MNQKARTDELVCTTCKGWLDPKWRACPRCGLRQARADRIDTVEKVTAVLAVIGGLALVVGAFLAEAKITLPDTPTQSIRVTLPGPSTQNMGGMAGGGGIVLVIFGVVAILVGVFALIKRRFAGNRPTLIAMGVLAFIFTMLERSLWSFHLKDLQFKSPAASMAFTGSFWLILAACVILVVAGAKLPAQLPVPQRPDWMNSTTSHQSLPVG